jgi:Co/Zn/Cd efflux system component
MHTHSLSKWQHHHNFSVIQEHGVKRTFQVLLLTAVTMVVEIIAGLVFGSMALLADGWHMDGNPCGSFFYNHLCLPLCQTTCR